MATECLLRWKLSERLPIEIPFYLIRLSPASTTLFMNLRYPHHCCFTILFITTFCLCVVTRGADQPPIRDYGLPPTGYEWARESSLKFTMEPMANADRNVMWRS